MVFNSYFPQSFNHSPDIVESLESEWSMFRAAIVEVAGQIYANKVAVANRGGNPRTLRWTPEEGDLQGSTGFWDNYRRAR